MTGVGAAFARQILDRRNDSGSARTIITGGLITSGELLKQRRDCVSDDATDCPVIASRQISLTTPVAVLSLFVGQ